MTDRGRRYALTNVHGLRLAIQATRVGVPPASASPADDASREVGGLPVVARAPLPREIAGSSGPVVALELVAQRLPRGARVDVPECPGAGILVAPVCLNVVRAIHFQSDAAREEFVAGLTVLEGAVPSMPATRATPRIFSGEWPSPPHGDGLWAERGRIWSDLIDRQTRVSAGLMVGCAVADDSSWSDECLANLRRAKLSKGCAGIRALADALARIDAIGGWTSDDLAQALDAGEGATSHRLRDHVRAWIAAEDPFTEADEVGAIDDLERALDVLLSAQGLGPRETGESIVTAATGISSPLVGALAALSLGRHLLPRSMRPAPLDAHLCDEELKAAARALSTHRAARQVANPKAGATRDAAEQQIGLWTGIEAQGGLREKPDDDPDDARATQARPRR